MKRTALSLLLALSAFAVQAQDATAPAEAAAPLETVENVEPVAESAAEVAPESEVIAHREHDRHCLRDTGTRLKRRDRNGCTSAIGESYTRDELRDTGGATVSESLRMLSPRVGG